MKATFAAIAVLCCAVGGMAQATICNPPQASEGSGCSSTDGLNGEACGADYATVVRTAAAPKTSRSTDWQQLECKNGVWKATAKCNGITSNCGCDTGFLICIA